MSRNAKPAIQSLTAYDGAYLTPKQLADYFGFHPMTVIRWCQKGTIQAGKVNHDWRIPIDVARQIEADLFKPRTTKQTQHSSNTNRIM